MHVAQQHGRDGGVALLYNSNIQLSKVQSMEARITTNARKPILLSIIYRPPPSKKKYCTTQLYFEEFGDLVERNLSSDNQMLLCGDYNFHVGDLNNREAMAFMDLISSFDLKQRVKSATHLKGHMFALILSSYNGNFVKETFTRDMNVSDHFWVHANL